MYSNEFETVVMSWNLGDILVTPGRTYFLRLDSLDGNGFNVYGTLENNYKNGNLWNGMDEVEGSDMVGFVVGAGHNYV